MSNREWLNTLSPAELVNTLCVMAMRDGVAKKLGINLGERSTSNWLNAEHKEGV